MKAPYHFTPLIISIHCNEHYNENQKVWFWNSPQVMYNALRYKQKERSKCNLSNIAIMKTSMTI